MTLLIFFLLLDRDIHYWYLKDSIYIIFMLLKFCKFFMSKEIEKPKKWDLCVIHLKHLWNTNIFHQDRPPIIEELDPSSNVPSLQPLLPNLKLLHLVFVIKYKIPIVYFRVSQSLWTCLVWLSFQWRGIWHKGAWIARWQQVKVKKKRPVTSTLYMVTAIFPQPS